MSYSSSNGRRPAENAGKINQQHIINDPQVKAFLGQCNLPLHNEAISLEEQLVFNLEPMKENPIKYVITIDGGYSTVPVKDRFPSSLITFYQFGALLFSMDDLQKVEKSPFIDPRDMANLKRIQRLKLVFPTKNISIPGEIDFIHVARKSIHEFFLNTSEGIDLARTLKWLLFEEYTIPKESYTLSRCPECGTNKVVIYRNDIDNEFKVPCPSCSNKLYLTDVFRLHEVMDNEVGAGGVVGYLGGVVEQLIIADILRGLLNKKPSTLGNILIIKDGPLALFGQTANIHNSMRALCTFLQENHNLYLVGLEKSGAFVDHAGAISNKLKANQVFVPNNKYIYKYILPGEEDERRPYAGSTYYGAKVILKASSGGVYVASIPVKNHDFVNYPDKKHLHNIDIILNNIQQLKSDMFDNALFPVAIVNKLVSLSYHPSAKILERFAKDVMSQH
jgi:hypothetical protein